MYFPSKRKRSAKHGFTLVEIMIVVVITGLLAAMSLPAISAARQKTQNALVTNDLRQFTMVFEVFLTDRRQYPPDANPGEIPEGMEGMLPPEWVKTTPLGGKWEWDYEPGSLIAVTLYHPTARYDQIHRIDQIIDDGVDGDGRWRLNGQEWNYLLEGY